MRFQQNLSVKLRPIFRMGFLSLQTSVIHKNSQVSAGCQEEVGLIFGSARELLHRSSVVPESESFNSCALPPSLEVTGMCLSSLGNILDVGFDGTVQGGHVVAVCTVVQKDVGDFGTVEQKEVVAAGTVRKCVSSVSYQSSIISPGLQVSDPMLEVGDGRCAGNMPPPPGVPRHARTSIPRVVQFRQARCPFPR